ncbi:MAG: Gfo/Idh/MocA family protein [Actinomycetales bacterium]
MTDPVRAVLVGAGLVGQVAHLRTLTAPESPIRLAGVVDASASRAATIGQAHRVPYSTTLGDLPLAGTDAVVIAAPDPAHRDLALQALQARLHVFIEKPLALTVDQGLQMLAAAEQSDRVCQVGYMKRFDPATSALLSDLRDRGARITAIAVEVRDPDASPFVREVAFVPGPDVPDSLIQESQRQFTAAVAEVLGRTPNRIDEVTYASYISALVHDLNLVRMLVPEPVVVETGFSALDGLQVGLHLRTRDGRLLRMTHTQDTAVADYQERLTVYTTAGIYELVFPAPYLLHEPTTLVRIDLKDEQERSRIDALNDSQQEAFELELFSFAEAIAAGRREPFQNPFSDGVEDLRLLGAAFRAARLSP